MLKKNKAIAEKKRVDSRQIKVVDLKLGNVSKS